MIKIYDIPKHIVKNSVSEAIKKYIQYYKRDRKYHLTKDPISFKKSLTERLKSCKRVRNYFIKNEYKKYSKVKVMEVIGEVKPFFLVYSEHDINRRSGTGGFLTYEDAVDWFVRGGR